MLIATALWLFQEPVVQHSSSLADLILRSSPIAKFVLIVLLVFSLASWAIILTKERSTRLAQRQSVEFLQVFARSSRLQDLYAGSSAFPASPLARIYVAAHEELRTQAGYSNSTSASEAMFSLDAVHRVMQSTAIAETTRLERSLGWLASTASAAPFIGLFGTVVGIIISFQGLSQASSASIQVVAPGIAEALIATAAGIAAAVPAVLAYNHYLNRIKMLAAEMDSFILRLLNFIEREAWRPASADGRGLPGASQTVPLGQGD
ncbi:MAG: MotA/TolQ/ExbB proton channel family protein [Acidobacteriota bacterium]